MRRARLGTRRGALLSAAVLAAGACAKLTGLDEYSKASTALCECQFVEGCEAYLDEKLAAMSAQEQAAWLELYTDLGCDKIGCEAARQCFYTVKDTCAPMGQECEFSEACCGFSFDAPAEGNQCCGAGGSGVCCPGCNSCQSILGGGDRKSICKSEEPLLAQLELCRDKNCSDKPCEPLESECVQCMQTHCFDQLTACQSGNPP